MGKSIYFDRLEDIEFGDKWISAYAITDEFTGGGRAEDWHRVILTLGGGPFLDGTTFRVGDNGWILVSYEHVVGQKPIKSIRMAGAKKLLQKLKEGKATEEDKKELEWMLRSLSRQVFERLDYGDDDW